MRVLRGRALEKREFAEKLLLKLQCGRRDGVVTPEAHLRASRICADYAEKFAGDIEAGRKRPISTVDVRAAVSYLTGIRHEPIASTVGKDPGYFYALTADEFKRACSHLLRRISKISAHYYGPLKKFEEKGSGDLFGKEAAA